MRKPMSRKQESFSSVFEVTTNAESVSSRDDSLGMDYASIPSEKDISFPVSFVSEEINSMISRWDACDLSATSTYMENRNEPLDFESAGKDNTENEESAITPNSGTVFEPSRRFLISAQPSDLPPPAKFQRSPKSTSSTLLAEHKAV